MTPHDELTGDDALAAEYVLGVLSADDRQQVAERIAADAAFVRLVDEWEVRLAPLGRSYGEAAPSAAVKAAIDRRLFGGAASSSPVRDFWRSLTLWRGLAAAAVAALLLVVAMPFVRTPMEPDDASRLVALLAADGSEVRYMAIYDAARKQVDLAHVAGVRDADRDFELWVIDASDVPLSIGVIPDGETVTVPLSEAARRRVAEGVTLAISVEPKGGSPTGQPTGAVVAAGDLRNI
jgi:anti-sigma-K factor RskA